MTDDRDPAPDTTPEDAAPAAEDPARAALARARAAARTRPARPGAAGGQARSGPGATGSTGRGSAPGEERLSGPGPDARDPQPLGSIVDRVALTGGWSEPLAIGTVLGRWADIVGADVAAHCTPRSLADGALVVDTDSTAWATQLRLLTATVLRRLDEEVGTGVVRTLDVRGPGAPSWRKGPRHVPGRGPRDTYG